MAASGNTNPQPAATPFYQQSVAPQGPGLGYHGDVFAGQKNYGIWAQDGATGRPTNPTPYTPPSSGGGGSQVIRSNGGAGDGMTQDQWAADQAYRAQEVQRQQDRLRGEITSGWDNYLGALGGMEGGLRDQRAAQEGIATSQYDQGVGTLENQKAKSLRDIGGNIRNAFQAGNIYLGARGAGDSSAANQYSFAVQQEGAKQTGNLNEFVTGKLQELGSQKNQQINQIAAWFADAKNQLQQQIATGQLNKSRDIQQLSQNLLNQAMQAKSQIEQNAQSQYNGLLQWAANNSQNVGQLQQNVAGIPQAIGMPSFDGGGNMRVPVGFGAGGSDEQRQRALF